MAKITTEDEMVLYCKGKLGWPVLNIELNDTMIKREIEDAVNDFQRYSYDEGVFKDYVILNLVSGVDEYSLSGQDITDTISFDLSFGADGINTLFSPTHELLYQDWVIKGNYPGGGSGPGLTMADYDISMMYLKEIQRHFKREYQVDYHPGREILKIFPTPKDNYTGALMIYRKEKAIYLYNHVLVKKLAVAKTEKLWGRVLGKFTIDLPGGGRVDGDKLFSRGEQAEKDALQEIRDSSPPVDFFIG